MKNENPDPDLAEREAARSKIQERVKESGLSQAKFAADHRVPLRSLERWLNNGPPNPVLDWIRMKIPQ